MISILNSRTVPEQEMPWSAQLAEFFKPSQVGCREEGSFEKVGHRKEDNTTLELTLEPVPSFIDPTLGRGVQRRRGAGRRYAEKTNCRDVDVMTVFKEKGIEHLLPVVKIEVDTLYTYQLTPFDSFLPKLLHAVKEIEPIARDEIQDGKFKFIHSKVIEMIDMYTTLHANKLVFCDTKAENFGLTRSENGEANKFQMLDAGAIVSMGSSTNTYGANKAYAPFQSQIANPYIDYWGLALMMFQMTLPSGDVDKSDMCKMALSNMPMIAVAKQLESVTEPNQDDWCDSSNWSAYIYSFESQLKENPPKLKKYGDKLDGIRFAAFELLKICVANEQPEFPEGILGHIKGKLRDADSPSQDFMSIVSLCH